MVDAPRVMTIGAPLPILTALRSALPAEFYESPADPSALDFWLKSSPDLVVIHADAPGTTLDLVAGLRQSPATGSSPVICVLPREDAEFTVQELVVEHGVDRVLFQPVDPRELAEVVATYLGFPARPPTRAVDSDREHVANAVAELWEQIRPTAVRRLDLLDTAAVDALAGGLTAEMRAQAEREAHRFAGSLGTYGLPEGTQLARAFEVTMARGVKYAQEQALKLADLANKLRTVIETSPPSRLPVEEDGRPLVLIAERDEDRAERLATAADARGYRASVAGSVAAAITTLAGSSPALVLLDTGAGDDTKLAYPLIERLTSASPPTPVVVLTDVDDFTDRVGVARAGGTGILSRSLSADAVVDAALALSGDVRADPRRILVVDDDPEILGALNSLLSATGLEVTTLISPLGFWDALRYTRPDLVMLDLDMPHLSGIELCRVMRSDIRWAALPVLFLTASDDSESIRKIFAAGADDYVRKPLVGPEIVARISNRLERITIGRRLAQLDPVSGALEREAAETEINRLLNLGLRYSQPVTVALVSPDVIDESPASGGELDEQLRRLVQVLSGTLRPEDVVGRWSERNVIVAMFGLARSDGAQLLTDGFEAFRGLGETDRGRKGIGATFSSGVASLPADGDDLRSLVAAAQNAVTAAMAGGGDRVVPAGWSNHRDSTAVDVAIVEDDPSLTELLVHTLGTRGLTTRVFTDGVSAHEALLGATADVKARLILLDIDLPGLDGLSLLREMRESGALEATRVIMLTGRAGQAEVVKALEYGAFDHVAKPFSIRVLMERVHKALTG